jgi:hypothetical protein
VGGLAGVAKQEAGLASGLLNTSQQLGGAIGIAIASTVAATHLKTLLGEGQTPSAALTGGFHYATFQLDDGMTFVHLSSTESDDGQRPAGKAGSVQAVPGQHRRPL